MPQVVLGLGIPPEKRFHYVELAAVFLVGAHMVPPGLDGSGGALYHPHPHFRNGPRGFSRSVGSHAFGRELIPATELMNPFAGVAVFLKSPILACSSGAQTVVRAPLLIEHDDVCPAAQLFHVPEAGGRLHEVSIEHAAPDAIGSACFLGRGGEEIPNL